MEASQEAHWHLVKTINWKSVFNQRHFRQLMLNSSWIPFSVVGDEFPASSTKEPAA
jgi:hypothetical protein